MALKNWSYKRSMSERANQFEFWVTRIRCIIFATFVHWFVWFLVSFILLPLSRYSNWKKRTAECLPILNLISILTTLLWFNYFEPFRILFELFFVVETKFEVRASSNFDPKFLYNIRIYCIHIHTRSTHHIYIYIYSKISSQQIAHTHTYNVNFRLRRKPFKELKFFNPFIGKRAFNIGLSSIPVYGKSSPQ